MKEAIAREYLDDQKKIHGHKHARPTVARSAFVTGAEKPASIGAEIVRMLTLKLGYENIWCPMKEHMDVRIRKNVKWFFETIPKEKKLDTLVCCHGITSLEWFEKEEPETLEEIIHVNLTGSMSVAQEFIRKTLNFPFRKQIIFIGSMAYNHVLNASAAYCASKAGLAMLTKCLAWELAPKGYDVYCIHPSNVLGTPMTEDTIQGIMAYRDVTRVEAEKYWSAVNPRNTWLTSSDIADVVRQLLTEQSSGFLAGNNIELAGGGR